MQASSLYVIKLIPYCVQLQDSRGKCNELNYYY